MTLPIKRAASDRRSSTSILSRACLCFLIFLFCVGSEQARAQAEGEFSLAEILATAPQVAGPAPAKNATPFLVTRVVPKGNGGDTCNLEVVTNGMSYDLFADGAAGCHHLPEYHAIQWGHLGGHLNRETLELVYSQPGEEVKTSTYFIRRSTRIDADWTEDE